MEGHDHAKQLVSAQSVSREARIDGRRVNLTVGWFATRSDTQGTSKAWQRTLGGTEQNEVNQAIAALDESATPATDPGACYSIVELTASGRKIAFTTSPKGPNYARVNALWRLLAGDGDVTLPAHSFMCPAG